MSALTNAQRRVLEGFVEYPQRLPETPEEASAYTYLRTTQMLGYNETARMVWVTPKGQQALREAHKQAT